MSDFQSMPSFYQILNNYITSAEENQHVIQDELINLIKRAKKHGLYSINYTDLSGRLIWYVPVFLKDTPLRIMPYESFHYDFTVNTLKYVLQHNLPILIRIQANQYYLPVILLLTECLNGIILSDQRTNDDLNDNIDDELDNTLILNVIIQKYLDTNKGIKEDIKGLYADLDLNTLINLLKDPLNSTHAIEILYQINQKISYSSEQLSGISNTECVINEQEIQSDDMNHHVYQDFIKRNKEEQLTLIMELLIQYNLMQYNLDLYIEFTHGKLENIMKFYRNIPLIEIQAYDFTNINKELGMLKHTDQCIGSLKCT